MNHFLKRASQRLLAKFGYELRTAMREEPVHQQGGGLEGSFPWGLWRKLTSQNQKRLAPCLPYLKSQAGQDFFVLCCDLEVGIPKFFIEAGAADGIQWSNTHFLEKQRCWGGLLVEPCRSFKDVLVTNRSAQCDSRCLSSAGGRQILFREVGFATAEFPLSSPELSCIDNAQPPDWASRIRARNATTYPVDTVTLAELIEAHNAPRHIGYLSLDTEGSELDILSSIDFSRYTIDIITVEHNQKASTMLGLVELLLRSDYRLVFDDISQNDFWFVREPLAARLSFLRQ